VYTHGGHVGDSQRTAEILHLGLAEEMFLPAAGLFGEHLESGGADGRGSKRGFTHSTCSRHMGAKRR
jgi:hypothetical protein